MKRAIGILLGLMLVASAGLAQARSSGGHGGGGRAAAPSARPGMSAGFARFTTGAPTQFTTGPHPVARYGVGYRPGPGYRARPTPIPPPPVRLRPPVVVGGGTVVVTAPYWYPAYPYPYPYPYVAPGAGGPAYAEVPSYSDAPAYADAPANADVPEYSNTPGYTERNDYWYYCQDSKTYYPYVSTCASPWVQVLPEPSGGTSN
jgi:hypothetical protein